MSTKKMMRILGVLCFLLAPLSFFGALYAHLRTGEYPETWYSISASFYTPAAPLMTGLLSMTGLVFICYDEYSKTDRRVTTATGITALCIVAFPCLTQIASKLVGIFLIPVEISNIFHCASAGLLFGLFAYMIGFRFTKHNSMGIKDIWHYTWHSLFSERKKATRNKVYYICAFIIVLFMIVQVITSILGIGWMTIVNEWVMLTAFSVAWLTKGGFVKPLND